MRKRMLMRLMRELCGLSSSRPLGLSAVLCKCHYTQAKHMRTWMLARQAVPSVVVRRRLLSG